LDGLTKYFSLLFEQVKIPINLYHIPFATGVPISHELLHTMEKYPHLAGIKDSASDPTVYQRFVAEFPKLNMRTGTTENLKYALDHNMALSSPKATTSRNRSPRYSPRSAPARTSANPSPSWKPR